MRDDCKWYNEKFCGHGKYNIKSNGTVSWIPEDLFPCTENCKGYYSRDIYYEELKNPKEYLKKYDV